MSPDRNEFERRLLALVRDYMDEADERYPAGYEIGDFVVLYELYERVADDAPLKPWTGGVRAGFESPVVGFSSTHTAWWLDEAWFAEALASVRARRGDAAPGWDATDDDDVDDIERDE